MIMPYQTDAFAILLRLCYAQHRWRPVTTLSLAPSLPPSRSCAIDVLVSA